MARATNGKSLVDQILDAWFAELEQAQEFDAPTLDGLKDLASGKALKKSAQVIKTIKFVPEVQDETP